MLSLREGASVVLYAGAKQGKLALGHFNNSTTTTTTTSNKQYFAGQDLDAFAPALRNTHGESSQGIYIYIYIYII